MDVTYKQNEMNVFQIVIQLKQIIKKEQIFPVADWIQRLTVIENQIKNRKFRLAVVGEFNRGKSSFINVLLGKKILPEDVLATTATINRVTYGETPKAYLIMKDGLAAGEEIPVEDLASYVTKLTESSAKAASKIQEAVVEYPTMLCYNDVDLIDTPGMNDVDDMNAITVNQLENIDLAVVVINAQYPYSETENRFVVKLLESENICQIIFVITHFDMIREREKVKMMDFLFSRIRDNVLAELEKHYEPDHHIFLKYHTIFDHLRLYGVSSVDGMDALESNDMELYEKSGFLRLNKELPEVILSSKSTNLLDNFVILVEQIICEYKTKLIDCKTEREKWDTVEQNIRKRLSDVSSELESVAELDIRIKELKQTAELKKQEMVKKILNSLGKDQTATFNSMYKSVLPVIQQEFRRIHIYFLKRKELIMMTLIAEKWPFFLDRIMDQMNDEITKYPQLNDILKTANEQLRKLLNQFFLNEKNRRESDSRISQFFADEIKRNRRRFSVPFASEAEKNQSVLSGLKRIVNQSVDECVKKTEDSLKDECNLYIHKIRKILNSYTQYIHTVIDKKVKNMEKEESLLSELDELQQECTVLHKMIRKNSVSNESI